MGAWPGARQGFCAPMHAVSMLPQLARQNTYSMHACGRQGGREGKALGEDRAGEGEEK